MILNDWLRLVLFEEEVLPPKLPSPARATFIERCLVEDIAPLMYYRLKKRGFSHLLPEEDLKTLEDFFLMNLGHNFHLRLASARILQCLNERQIPHVLLKGLALSLFYYPHPATRRMTDVDILVRKEDLPVVDACLSDFGYLSVDSHLKEALRNPPGYLSSLEYHAPDGRPILHLHWHLVNTSVPFPVTIDYPLADLWQTAKSVEIEGIPTFIPSPEHLMLHLAEHGLRINHSYDRLILIYDLYAVLQRERIDWDELKKLASAAGLAPFVFFSLVHLAYWDKTGLPSFIIEQFRPETLSPAQRLYLYLANLDVRARGLSYLIYLSLARGGRRKVWLIGHSLFPPAGVGRQRLRDKSMPTWKIYGQRWREVALAIGRLLRLLLIRVGGRGARGPRRFSRD